MMSNERKPIRVHWVAPNGKQYEDTVRMTLADYDGFVHYMLKIKTDSELEKQS